MERLRRSFRNSFRRKKPQQPESSKPHQWEADEQAVRNGTCSFAIKYLGCVQVEESRGMHVCEQALLRLKSQRHKSIKGLLYVSGDGLRVVDDETKGLIVDQTIEKVSFCAPDRNLERGFSYICRDGTTRRWMCHGFLAAKDTGERLSHAVGCAFSVCLERKQKRDLKLNETNNNHNSSANSSSNTSHNGTMNSAGNHNNQHTLNSSTSASVSTISDSNASSLNSVGLVSSATNGSSSTSVKSSFQRAGSFRRVPMIQRIKDPQECKTIDPVPIKEVVNPYAIERPHATPQLLERQGSFRIFNSLNQSSPFKRQLSLRVHSSNSRLDRQRNNSLQASDPLFGRLSVGNHNHSAVGTAINGSTTAQSNVSSEKQSETIAEMCKELSQGFTILSNRAEQPMNSNAQQIRSAISITNRSAPKPPIEANVVNKKFGQLSNYTEDLLTNVKLPILTAEPCRRASPAMSLDSLSMTSNSLNATRLNTSTQSSVKQTDLDCFTGFEADFDKHFGSNGQPLSKDSPRKWTNQLPKPTLNGIITNSSMNESFAKPITNGSTITSSNEPFDPFDAEWVSLAARHGNDYIKNTNPFLVTTSAVKAFEIKM